MHTEPSAKKGRRQQLWTSFQSALRSTPPPSRAAVTLSTKSSEPPVPIPTSSLHDKKSQLLVSPSQQPPVNTPSRPVLLELVLDRLAKLSQEDFATIQIYIPRTVNDADDALNQVLTQAQTLQKHHLDKRWTFTFNNRTYVVRERVDKIIEWLNRFKAVGDIVANVDPVHVGLPWAGIRLLLEAATSEGNQISSLLTGCETALYMSNRLKVYSEFLNQLPPTLARNNFEAGMIEFYAFILSFFARAIRLYTTRTPLRVVQSFWKDDEITEFNTRCDQLGSRVEIEASNCDRYLLEQRLRQTVDEIRLLHVVQVSSTQIDDVIRQTYNNGRLNVERLSGRSLSLEYCFVNLGIVKHIHDVDSLDHHGVNSKVSGFSLAARLKVETPLQSNQISLNTLFEKRTQNDGSFSRPTRILIWGRAGMGKTTLCKKIVHEVCNRGLWQEIYDRVIWLPLRRLKRVEVRDAVELLQYEFPFTGLGDRLPETLRKLIQDERTLFLLDGLDEVSFALDQDGPGGRILHELVSRSHTIITSRPHSTRVFDNKPPDFELESVGFFPQQVEEYLQRVAMETKMTDQTVREIKSFIQSRPLVQSLARIPIQLDAICYTWSTKDFPHAHVTMTNLYQTIVPNLWKSTIIRLEKRHEGELITKQQLEDWPDIEDFIQNEISVLQELAFQGLNENIVDFTVKDITRSKSSRRMLNSTFVHTSFLRTSDNSVEASDRTWHFIHLTFQEFFAAQHFVQHWMSGKVIHLRKGALHDGGVHGKGLAQYAESTTPENFLRMAKLSDRYDIFWRFVVGLLSSESDKAPLHSLLDALEDKPIDLIGRTHQRTVIHCLSEIVPDDDELNACIQTLENCCQQWILGELRLKSKWTGQPQTWSLMWEVECSDNLLKEFLTKDETREEALRAICHRANISSNLLDMVFQVLGNSHDETIRTLAIRAVGMFCGSDQKAKLMRLCDESSGLWSRPLELTRAWIDTQRLLDPAVETLVSFLQSLDQSICIEAAHALAQQATLSEGIVWALISLLQAQDPAVDRSVRSGAAYALRQQTVLPEAAVEALVSTARDKDLDQLMRSKAFYALGGLADYHGPTIDSLASPQEDEDLDQSVWFEAEQATGAQALDLDLVVEALVTLIQGESQEPSIQSVAGQTVKEHTALCNMAASTLDSLIRNRDIDPLIRRRVVFSLALRGPLPGVIIESLVSFLRNQDLGSDRPIWYAVTLVLREHPPLSDTAIEALALLLQCTSPSDKPHILYIIGEQPTLPSSVVQALVSSLEEVDEDIVWAASWALRLQTSLPIVAIKALISLLTSPNHEVRLQVSFVLSQQVEFPSEAVEVLIALLHDPNTPIYQDATYLVVNRPETLRLFPSLKWTALRHFVTVWTLTDEETCFVWEGQLYITSPDGTQKIPLQDHELKSFESEWSRAREDLGLHPTPSVLPAPTPAPLEPVTIT